MGDDNGVTDWPAVWAALGAKLRSRRPWYLGLKYYNFQWDAVCWFGEVPWRLTSDEMVVLVSLLHYRTQRNLGRRLDHPGWEQEWEACRAVFPWWAGFAPSRNRPSRSFRRFYLQARRYESHRFREAMREWDDA